MKFMMIVMTNKRGGDGEQRLVADRSGGLVALGGLGDEAGHRLRAVERVERQAGGLTGGQRHDHGLADRPADAENDGGDDARDRRRDDDPKRHLHARAAQTECAVAQRLRHR